VAQATGVAGVALQPGDTTLLLLAAAGRDEQVYPQPDALVLERARRPLPGFGHGRHACPGQDLEWRLRRIPATHCVGHPRLRLDGA
jgi:cytochrome P450